MDEALIIFFKADKEKADVVGKVGFKKCSVYASTESNC